METLTDSLVEDMLKSINKKKHDILCEVIFAKTPLKTDEDINIEMSKRFPRLVVETKDNEEIYYWNDGSKYGVRLIGFRIINNTEYDSSDFNPIKLISEIKII